MEEKKTLKIKKPYVVIITLAIVFAILGFMDLKVWAMESYNVNIDLRKHLFESDGTEIENSSVWNNVVSFSDEVSIYYYTSSDTAVVSEQKACFYAVCKQKYTDYDVEITINNQIYYVTPAMAVSLSYMGSSGGGYYEYIISGDCQKYKLNTYYDQNGFANALRNGSVDCKEIIDYSNLFVDENMKYIEDIKGNRICFETLPEYTYFDYLTWKNDTTYEIQVERTPIVYFYKGYLNRELLHSEYMGFKPYDILPTGSSKLNCESDVANFHRLYPDDYEWYRNVIDNSNYNHDYVKLGFGYRLRYVDVLNKKASIWIYIIPTYDVGEKGQGYLKFIQYSDGSFSHYIDVTGVQKSWNYFNDNKIETMEDVENIIDNALQYMDNRNEFKEDYGINDNSTFVPPLSNGGGSSSGNIVTDIDVNGATNWLQSVATFIKGTPAFVGSVLSFLPQPILYGIYVCIFLSVIAGGYAIIKALI